MRRPFSVDDLRQLIEHDPRTVLPLIKKALETNPRSPRSRSKRPSHHTVPRHRSCSRSYEDKSRLLSKRHGSRERFRSASHERFRERSAERLRERSDERLRERSDERLRERSHEHFFRHTSKESVKSILAEWTGPEESHENHLIAMEAVLPMLDMYLHRYEKRMNALKIEQIQAVKENEKDFEEEQTFRTQIAKKQDLLRQLKSKVKQAERERELRAQEQVQVQRDYQNALKKLAEKMLAQRQEHSMLLQMVAETMEAVGGQVPSTWKFTADGPPPVYTSSSDQRSETLSYDPTGSCFSSSRPVTSCISSALDLETASSASSGELRFGSQEQKVFQQCFAQVLATQPDDDWLGPIMRTLKHQPLAASSSETSSLQQQASMEQQPSVERQASMQRQASMERHASMERQASMERHVSMERQASMERQVQQQGSQTNDTPKEVPSVPSVMSNQKHDRLTVTTEEGASPMSASPMLKDSLLSPRVEGAELTDEDADESDRRSLEAQASPGSSPPLTREPNHALGRSHPPRLFAPEPVDTPGIEPFYEHQPWRARFDKYQRQGPRTLTAARPPKPTSTVKAKSPRPTPSKIVKRVLPRPKATMKSEAAAAAAKSQAKATPVEPLTPHSHRVGKVPTSTRAPNLIVPKRSVTSETKPQETRFAEVQSSARSSMVQETGSLSSVVQPPSSCFTYKIPSTVLAKTTIAVPREYYQPPPPAPPLLHNQIAAMRSMPQRVDGPPELASRILPPALRLCPAGMRLESSSQRYVPGEQTDVIKRTRTFSPTNPQLMEVPRPNIFENYYNPQTLSAQRLYQHTTASAAKIRRPDVADALPRYELAHPARRNTPTMAAFAGSSPPETTLSPVVSDTQSSSSALPTTDQKTPSPFKPQAYPIQPPTPQQHNPPKRKPPAPNAFVPYQQPQEEQTSKFNLIRMLSGPFNTKPSPTGRQPLLQPQPPPVPSRYVNRTGAAPPTIPWGHPVP